MPKGEQSLGADFLNVDLDIYSKSDLRPLVDGFGKKVIALHVGRERRNYSAHLELAGLSRPSADSTICAFCTLVRALPKAARKIWNEATTREFSVGVQAGKTPLVVRDFRIEAQTVKAVAELRAVIVLTVYGPEGSQRRTVSN